MSSNNKPVISEAKLRRIIREELARQYLVQEGIMDVISKPFKKLSDKAKKAVSAKTEELLEKLKTAAGNLKNLDSAKALLKSFESQKGGMSFQELTSTLKLDDLSKEAEEIKGSDIDSLIKSPVKEGISYEDFRMGLILVEERYDQKYGHQRLNESVVGAVAGLWWTATKTVVGFCGLVSFILGSGMKVAKFLGFDKIAEYLKKAEHFVEHVEEAFLEKVAFPKPAQYAVYRAFHAIKSGSAKNSKKEGPGEALSYEQFNSSEGKEEREAALKAIKAAVIFVLVLDALAHIIKGIGHFLHAISESGHEALEASKHVASGAQHAGVEAAEFSKTARAALKAGEEMSAAGAVVSASSSNRA